MPEQKINYQHRLEQIIKTLDPDSPPRLLLHACCAPCSSYCLEYLAQYFSITVFYYNPNIYPEEEFDKRTAELERLVRELPVKNPVKVIVGDYDPREFYEAIKGFEHVPEGGERCVRCFRLRLEHTAKLARKLGMDYFTTTLTISPMKDAQTLNRLAQELGEIYETAALPTDFKKKGGYHRSVELSREYGLYRQDYCGCVFSRQERERMKAEKAQNDNSEI